MTLYDERYLYGNRKVTEYSEKKLKKAIQEETELIYLLISGKIEHIDFWLKRDKIFGKGLCSGEKRMKIKIKGEGYEEYWEEEFKCPFCRNKDMLKCANFCSKCGKSLKDFEFIEEKDWKEENK